MYCIYPLTQQHTQTFLLLFSNDASEASRWVQTTKVLTGQETPANPPGAGRKSRAYVHKRATTLIQPHTHSSTNARAHSQCRRRQRMQLFHRRQNLSRVPLKRKNRQCRRCQRMQLSDRRRNLSRVPVKRKKRLRPCTPTRLTRITGLARRSRARSSCSRRAHSVHPLPCHWTHLLPRSQSR